MVMLAGEVSRFRDSIFGNSNINLKFHSIEKIRKVNYNIPVNDSELFMNPTPLQRNDFLLAGADPGNDSDDEGIADGGCTHYCEDKNGIADGKHVVLCGVHKATIPIARLRELVDADDVSDNLTYRCSKCSKCQECKSSTKNRAISTQERVEQAVIEESVKLDLENKRVT